jgi:hypothetical protein
MTRLLHSLSFALALAAALPATAPAATEATAPSAQSLLFDAEYLRPLPAPSRIAYDYVVKTADEQRFGKAFNDEVALRLAPAADGNGEKDVFVDMFTGDRQRVIGPLARVAGNPIIMMFLERDVSQMNMHIGGQPVYFRNVIRLAFREKAKLEPASFQWDGRQVNGTKVTIQPFMGDPNGERMQFFRTKTYEFIVSDAVPGGIYQMHSTIADDSQPAPAAPAIDITMTLKGVAQ